MFFGPDIMSRLQRTPPTSLASENQRSKSSPDVSNIDPETEPFHVTSRNKRLRPDFSPEHPDSDFKSFEEKIMDLLITWKNDQDVLFRKLTSDINEVKIQNKAIQKTNIEIEKSIDFMNTAYEALKTSVEKLEKDRLDQRAYILELEKKVIDVQQITRSSSIEIRNIASSEKETTADLESVVLQTCSTLQVPVNQTDLRDVYRLPGKKSSNRSIIAEFTTVPLKIRVLDAARTFNKGRSVTEKLNSSHIGIKGDAKPIYVADHLCSSIRQLFFESRKFAYAYGYKFCWT